MKINFCCFQRYNAVYEEISNKMNVYFTVVNDKKSNLYLNSLILILKMFDLKLLEME